MATVERVGSEGPREIAGTRSALAPWIVATSRYTLALLAGLALVPGCSDDPGAPTGAGPGAGAGEDGDGDGDPGGPPTAPAVDKPVEAPAHDPTFGEKTLARARLWVAAKMPYCGGPNGGKDLICGGTCERDGAANNAEWDKYRSDCSGFVSWSWGLAAPGRTTSTLAPYDTTASVLIKVDDLRPGDALNGGQHVMLFAGWTDRDAGKATILQESRCGTVATEKVSTFTKVGDTTLRISDGRTFRTIRAKAAK